MGHMLLQKKVLLNLDDDVGKLEQLEAFIGKLDWLGLFPFGSC